LPSQVLVDDWSKKERAILEDVEMQEMTEAPPSVVPSNLVETLPVDDDLFEVSSEKEEADAVFAEPVSEEKGAKGWALRNTWIVAIRLFLIVAAIVAAIGGRRIHYSSRQ
jgi:hypothetical protein